MAESDRGGFGRREFRFVVVADTHVNAEDGKTTSPFAANAKANARAAAAIADINRWQPAFVVHLGDIVHPVPGLPGYEPACERFKALAQAFDSPLHLVAGNHDVGDKPVQWMPAGSVTQDTVETYRRLFGPDFYAFRAHGVRGVVLNAQILNSGLPAEAQQRAWLEAELAASAGERTFLFIHYPPYVSERHEAGNYDNLDEPGRTWLLDLIERYHPEALFAGHVHNQWYDRFDDTEIYILPSTAFVRQDYAELFRVAPLREYGRDDSPKLGYYLIDVYERGHVAHFIRTDGVERAQPSIAAQCAPLSPVHTKTNARAPVGVDMRHAWVEWVDVPATGGVQEFERKRVRNDYPAIALWEMGVRKLRVPLQDVLDAPVRARMALLRRVGHRYTAYVFGCPSPAAQATLRAHRGLVDALEVVIAWDDVASTAEALAPLRDQLGITVYLSKLRRHEDAKFDGSKFNHFINHGFVLAEQAQLQAFAGSPAARAVDGFVLRVASSRSPWDDIAAGTRLASALGRRIALHVRLAADNPAEPVVDDGAIANRVAETVFGALCTRDADVFFDSFADVDRNYFPHHGLVDRRYDPRPASYVYRHLHVQMAAQAGMLEALACGGNEQERWYAAGDEEGVWVLIVGANTLISHDLAECPLPNGAGITAMDLVNGKTIAARRIGTRVECPRPASGAPVLLRIG